MTSSSREKRTLILTKPLSCLSRDQACDTSRRRADTFIYALHTFDLNAEQRGYDEGA